jgi:hypothetical protein
MEVAMNDLSRESRALIAAARPREGLRAADKHRIRGKITQRLGAGLALGSAVTASATVAEAAHTTFLGTVAAWLPGAAKVVSVVAIAGGVTVGAVHVAQRKAPTLAVVVNAPRAEVPASHENTKSVPAAQPLSESPLALGEPEVSPAVVREPPAAKREVRMVHAASIVNEPVAPPEAKPVDDGLSSQVAAIREARAAIRRGDGASALAALDKGLPQGQGGPLEQEAILARVSALCLLGNVAAAKRAAEQFLARFPDSLLAPRVRNSCAFGASGSP